MYRPERVFLFALTRRCEATQASEMATKANSIPHPTIISVSRTVYAARILRNTDVTEHRRWTPSCKPAYLRRSSTRANPVDHEALRISRRSVFLRMLRIGREADTVSPRVSTTAGSKLCTQPCCSLGPDTPAQPGHSPGGVCQAWPGGYIVPWKRLSHADSPRTLDFQA